MFKRGDLIELSSPDGDLYAMVARDCDEPDGVLRVTDLDSGTTLRVRLWMFTVDTVCEGAVVRHVLEA